MLFAYGIDVLERPGIPYMVVGGFAAVFYGEPRLTLDVDIVVEMNGWFSNLLTETAS